MLQGNIPQRLAYLKLTDVMRDAVPLFTINIILLFCLFHRVITFYGALMRLPKISKRCTFVCQKFYIHHSWQYVLDFSHRHNMINDIYVLTVKVIETS